MDSEHPTSSTPKSGVSYISESLIKKNAKEDNLLAIKSLNLCSTVNGDKKIKYIEKLEGLKNLRTLQLSCNCIERIEKLDKLVHLQELNLSFNRIIRLDGLESLVSLRVLLLRGNLIETIPAWFSKKLLDLRMLDLGQNHFSTLRELIRLRPLSNLSSLDVDENPIMTLPHTPLYLSFHLKTLDRINGKFITDAMRDEALKRFDQVEIVRLQRQVDESEEKLLAVTEKLIKFERDSKSRDEREREINKKLRKGIQERQELQEKLKSKDTLLKKKSEELMKACHKHFELEQELAFYKIDSKFDRLGRPPPMHQDDATTYSSTESGSETMGESPYVGKGRFAEHKRARKGISVQPQSASLFSMPQPENALAHTVSVAYPATIHKRDTSSSPFSFAEHQREFGVQMNDHFEASNTVAEAAVLAVKSELDYFTEQLQEKQALIAEAENQLQQLNEDIAESQDRMEPSVEATQRFHKELQQHLRNVQNLSKKADSIQQEIVIEEENLAHYQEESQQQSANKSSEDKAVQINAAIHRIEHLNNQLDKILRVIQRENEVIKNLQNRLAPKAIATDSNQQQLMDLIRSLEADLARRKTGQQDPKQIQNLQTTIKNLEKDLLAARNRSAELEQRLQDFEQSQSSLSERVLLQERDHLKDMEEIRHLKNALKRLQETSEAEKEELEMLLEEERVGRLKLETATSELKKKQAIELMNQQLIGQVNALTQQHESHIMENEHDLEQFAMNIRQWTDRINAGEKVEEVLQDVCPTGGPTNSESTLLCEMGVKDELDEFTKALVKNIKQDFYQQFEEYQYSTEMELYKLREQLLEKMEEEESQKIFQQTTATQQQQQLLAKSSLPTRNHHHHHHHTTTSTTGQSTRNAPGDGEMNTDSDTHSDFHAPSPSHPTQSAIQNNKAGKFPTHHDVPHPLTLHHTPTPSQIDNSQSPNVFASGGSEYGNYLVQMLRESKSQYSLSIGEMRGQIDRLEDAIERTRKDPSGMSSTMTPRESLGLRHHPANSAKAAGSDPPSTAAEDLTTFHSSIGGLEGVRIADYSGGIGTSAEPSLKSTPRSAGNSDYSFSQTRQREPPLQSHHSTTPTRKQSQSRSRKPSHFNSFNHESVTTAATNTQHQSTNPSENRRRPLQKANLNSTYSPHQSDHNTYTAMSRPASKLMQPTPPSQQPNQFLPRSTTFAGMPEGGSSSDERGVLLELQMELNNLRRQLDATEKTNAHKMDEAAQHIGILEEELHRRDENDRIMQEEIMKNMWEQQLNGMIVELEACQRNIQDLQARLEEKENQAVYHESHSVKDILEKQKQEIARLSGLLDRFSGLPVSADPGRQIPAAVEPPSREDLLRRNFQHALYPAASQRFSNRPASAIGVTAQFPPYLHPVPPSPVFPNSRGPIHVDGLLQHSMSNPVLSNPHSYRHTPASVLQCEAAPTGGLYCNVPEHHHLEDYLQTLHQKNQTLKEKMNQRKIAEHDEEVRVLRKIRREIEVKHEELDEVNVEMERKQISIERLLTREKELLQSAEELQRQLMLLRQKSNEVATETFEKETRLQAERDLLQLKQMSERQSYLQTEVHCLEETIAMRKLELSSVESRLTGAKDNLDKVKVEMQNSKSCLEETEANYTRTILECEELEKRAREASYELVRANSDLMELRRKVGTLSAEKQKLELALEDVKRVLVKKDEDFQRLCRQLTINQSNLHSLQDTLLVASEEEKEKLTYIQEADKILAERKQELERLKDQIHQEEIRLEKLDETVGERKAQLHLTETQFHRRQEEQQRFCRELEQEIRIRTQDVEEIRASIDSLQEKREQLDKTIDQMLKEKSRLKQELQSERENFRILIRQVQEKEAEKEQLSHSILLEQANLNNLKTQCHEKSTLLEHVNESLTEKQKSIEEFQAICKRKKTDLDTTRDLAAREKQELDSLEEIKQTLRCSIKQLKEEKEILFEQKCQLDNNVAAARREISRLEDQINYSKNRLEVLQSDCLSAQQNAEDIRRDKDRLNVEIRELEVKLQSSRSQLAMEKGRLDSSNEDYDRLSKKIAEKQSLRDQLTQEVDNLMRQCRGHKTQCEELKKNMAELQDQRDQLCLQLSDSQVELRDITQSIADLKCNHRMEEEKSHKMMQDNQRDLKNLDEAVSKKEMMLKELSVKLREIQVKMIEEDRTDKKIDQLLQMLQEKTEELESHQEDKQHLTESLEHSYAELLVLRNQLAHERDSKETLSHKFATELQAARRELQEQERSHRHNLKCCREEMKQLQMTAEEQCNRANRLSEELNQSRHDYILLRRQAEIFASVLEDSSTAFINQQDVLQREKYMEQTMKAVKADVEMDRVRAKLFAQSTPETEDSGIAGNGIPHRHHAFSDGLSSPLFSRQENDAYKKLQRIRLSNNNDLEESHSRLERETRQFQEDLLNRLPSSHLNSTFKPTYTSIYTRSSDVTAQPSGVALDENKWPTPDKGTSSSGTASKTNGHSSSITVQRISAANFNASGTLQLPGGEHALSDCSSAHSTPPPLPLLMSTSPEKGVCA